MTGNDKSIIARKVVGIFTLELRKDGILHRHVSSESNYDVGAYPELNEEIGAMVNFKAVPTFVTADELVVFPVEANAILAKKNSSPYSSAEAYLVSNLAQQLVVNFYIRNYKPERPTQLFEKEEDAITWLKTFL